MKDLLNPMADVINAHFATPLGSMSGGEVALPPDIQWMPPGSHKVTATKGGEPIELDIHVDAKTAERMQTVLEGYLAAAKDGSGDWPYLDFNHDDKEAAAQALEFFWGGEDPVSGGVRLKVNWTAPGKEAITGRAYRRFSPSFLTDKGNVTGAPVNMGGLVNRAAFRKIQPLFTKDKSEGEEPSQTKRTMNEEQIKALQAENEQLKAKVAKLEGDSTVKAKEAEIDTLKAKNKDLQDRLDEQRKIEAKNLVEAAAAEGKLPAKNEELKARWVDLLVADDKNRTLLDGLPVNAALKTVIPNGSGGAAKGTGAGHSGENEFLVKAKQIANAKGIEICDAASELAESDPDAYDEYRKGLHLGQSND